VRHYEHSIIKEFLFNDSALLFMLQSHILHYWYLSSGRVTSQQLYCSYDYKKFNQTSKYTSHHYYYMDMTVPFLNRVLIWRLGDGSWVTSINKLIFGLNTVIKCLLNFSWNVTQPRTPTVSVRRNFRSTSHFFNSHFSESDRKERKNYWTEVN